MNHDLENSTSKYQMSWLVLKILTTLEERYKTLEYHSCFQNIVSLTLGGIGKQKKSLKKIISRFVTFSSVDKDLFHAYVRF